MIPANNKIIVRVEMKQKESMTIGGISISCARKYQLNNREKAPVIACVVKGNKVIKQGDVVLCHHNHFYAPSPYFLEDDLFAVPFNKTLFAIVDTKGQLRPICGNIICERVEVETEILLPADQRKTHINRVRVIDAGNLPYKAGQLLFHRPNAGYDIVYIYNSVEYRVTKISSDMVCGVIM